MEGVVTSLFHREVIPRALKYDSGPFYASSDHAYYLHAKDSCAVIEVVSAVKGSLSLHEEVSLENFFAQTGNSFAKKALSQRIGELAWLGKNAVFREAEVDGTSKMEPNKRGASTYFDQSAICGASRAKKNVSAPQWHENVTKRLSRGAFGALFKKGRRGLGVPSGSVFPPLQSTPNPI